MVGSRWPTDGAVPSKILSKILADIARYEPTSTGLPIGMMPARWHDLTQGERSGSDF
jgi:hypothetical protein